MRIILPFIISFFLTLSSYNSINAQNDVRFTTDPTISPDSKSIIFPMRVTYGKFLQMVVKLFD